MLQKASEVQRDALAHPDGALGMVPQLDRGGRAVLDGVRVDEHGERAPPDGEPRYEGAELRRRE